VAGKVASPTHWNIRGASGDVQGGCDVQPAPCQNHLLASLPLADYQRLLPALEGVPLPAGWTVHDAGEEDRYLYFLTAGIVSRIHATKDGTLTDFGVTGNVGVVGIASFPGGASTPSRAVVLCAGYSCRLPVHQPKNGVRARRPAAASSAALPPGPDRKRRDKSRCATGVIRWNRVKVAPIPS
jgi:hypothetical protein